VLVGPSTAVTLPRCELEESYITDPEWRAPEPFAREAKVYGYPKYLLSPES
jgi:hypothetical protein